MKTLFMEVLKTMVYLKGFEEEASYMLSRGLGIKADLTAEFRSKWEAMYGESISKGTYRSLRQFAKDVVASMLRNRSISIGPRELSYWSNSVVNSMMDAANIYDDVRSALDALMDRGVQLYILTNLDNDIAKKILLKHGLLRYFKGVISPDLTGVGKPSMKIFQVALAKAGADLESSLIVSGLPEDAVGSKLSRIRMAFVNRDRAVPVPQPDYVVNDLGELVELMDSIWGS
ncbi:haloacetate dehalogenase [Thermocladium modestius]|uniref:Haloacetate dehalogenase n=1 Tax=Thermocladium modestius TaxID=62609 RepID=A0A830GUN2_9CREN|nr:HAD family hydrolase [Thermocladium modestius]GGP19946.1 haloacetate dehalogenase [Thermocladium modestius]